MAVPEEGIALRFVAITYIFEAAAYVHPERSIATLPSVMILGSVAIGGAIYHHHEIGRSLHPGKFSGIIFVFNNITVDCISGRPIGVSGVRYTARTMPDTEILPRGGTGKIIVDIF